MVDPNPSGGSEADRFHAELVRFREEHQPKAVAAGGARFEYVTGGASDGLLVLHGGGGPAESLFRYLGAFEQRHRLIAPTLPCCAP